MLLALAISPQRRGLRLKRRMENQTQTFPSMKSLIQRHPGGLVDTSASTMRLGIIHEIHDRRAPESSSQILSDSNLRRSAGGRRNEPFQEEELGASDNGSSLGAESENEELPRTKQFRLLLDVPRFPWNEKRGEVATLPLYSLKVS